MQRTANELTAETLAERFGRDGTRFTDGDGVPLDEAIAEHAPTYHRCVDGGDVAQFADGSGLFTSDNGWDPVVRLDVDGEPAWQSLSDVSVVYR